MARKQDPTPTPNTSYRLNAHTFLGYHKLWLELSVLLLLIGYGLVAHLIALHVGAQSPSSLWYPASLILLLLVPVVTNLLSPDLAHPGRRARLGFCRRGSERWQQDQDAYHQFSTEKSALDRLWQQLDPVFRLVTAADPSLSRRHQNLEVWIEEGMGMPYTYASSGRLRMLFPIRLLSALDDEQVGYLLAPEMAHVAARGAPSSPFLIRWASVLHAMVGTLLLVLMATLPFLRLTPRPAPHVIRLALFSLFLVLVLAPFYRHVRVHLELRFGLLRGHLGAGALAAVLLFSLGALLASQGFTRTPLSVLGLVNWRLSTLTLVLLWLLTQIYILMGRRQIQTLTEEDAIAALLRKEGATPLAVRMKMWDTLMDVQEVVEKAPDARPVPALALGFATGAGRLVSSLPSWACSLFMDHPTWEERRRNLLCPDHAVEHVPFVPLICTTLPILVLPALFNQAAELTFWIRSALLGTPLLTLLFLFAFIARRPVSLPAREEVPQPPDVGFTPAIKEGSRAQAQAAGSAQERGPAQEHALSRRTPGMFEETLWVALAFFLASFVSAALVGISTDHPGIEVPWPSFTLPLNGPLHWLGSALLLTSVLLGWYLLCKFMSLSQWHFYQGAPWYSSLGRQLFHLGVSFLLSAMLLGLCKLLLQYVPTLFSLILHRKLALDTFWLSAIQATAGFFLFGLVYAMLVYHRPWLATQVTCPDGHLVSMSWHDMLERPGPGRENAYLSHLRWEWLICPQCGLPPQARKHLIRDEAGVRTRRGISAGWGHILLQSLLVAFGASYLLVVLGSWVGSLIVLDTVNACKILRPLAPAEGEGRFAECGGRVEPTWIPGKPSAAPLIDPRLARNAASGADLARGEIWSSEGVIEYLQQPNPLIPLEFFLTCRDRLARLRNQIAFLQTCSQAPPRGDMPSCAPQDIERPEVACRCLWSYAAQPSAEALPGLQPLSEEARARLDESVLSGLRLYQQASRLAHLAKPACTGEEEPSENKEAWKSWHDYLEFEVTPRLFLALAAGLAPDAYFSDARYPAPLAGDDSANLRRLAWTFDLPALSACGGKQETLQQCLEAMPGWIETWLGKGCEHRDLKAQGEAEQQCRQTREQMEKCAPCLGAYQAAQGRPDGARSCRAVMQEAEENYCDGLPGNARPCARLWPQVRACRKQFQALWGYLTPEHARRLLLEDQSAVALLRVHGSPVQSMSQAQSELLFFAQVQPSLVGMKQTAESSARLRSAISFSWALDRSGCSRLQAALQGKYQLLAVSDGALRASPEPEGGLQRLAQAVMEQWEHELLPDQGSTPGEVDPRRAARACQSKRRHHQELCWRYRRMALDSLGRGEEVSHQVLGALQMSEAPYRIEEWSAQIEHHREEIRAELGRFRAQQAMALAACEDSALSIQAGARKDIVVRLWTLLEEAQSAMQVPQRRLAQLTGEKSDGTGEDLWPWINSVTAQSLSFCLDDLLRYPGLDAALLVSPRLQTELRVRCDWSALWRRAQAARPGEKDAQAAIRKAMDELRRGGPAYRNAHALLEDLRAIARSPQLPEYLEPLLPGIKNRFERR